MLTEPRTKQIVTGLDILCGHKPAWLLKHTEKEKEQEKGLESFKVAKSTKSTVVVSPKLLSSVGCTPENQVGQVTPLRCRLDTYP